MRIDMKSFVLQIVVASESIRSRLMRTHHIAQCTYSIQRQSALSCTHSIHQLSHSPSTIYLFIHRLIEYDFDYIRFGFCKSENLINWTWSTCNFNKIQTQLNWTVLAKLIVHAHCTTSFAPVCSNGKNSVCDLRRAVYLSARKRVQRREKVTQPTFFVRGCESIFTPDIVWPTSIHSSWGGVVSTHLNSDSESSRSYFNYLKCHLS